MNIAQALQLSGQLSSDTAKLDAEVLLAFTLEQSRTYLYTWPERALSVEQEAHFKDLIARRAAGEPVAYIVKHKDFWSLPIEVGPSTLIPRPDTEVLIETALTLIDVHAHNRILDLGSGTGAIALALASECLESTIVGVDVQAEAVDLANKNAARLNLHHARFFHSRWFSDVDGMFDLIVSNPPYIDETDPHLSQGDVRFEPSTALVAKNKGMADLEVIVEQAPVFLNAGAYLLLEHGYDQAERVRTCLLARGYHNIVTKKDYGDNDRVTSACWGESNG